ncbi:MAG: ABC transporter permease [Longimicrobiales bacterium]
MKMNAGSVYEGVRLAIDQLRANKFRSALTILGIVIGVATVMAMSAMIGGIRGSVLSELEAIGPKNFIVVRYNFNEARVSSDGPPPWERNPPLTAAEARSIERLDRIASTIVDFDLNGDFSVGSDRVGGVQISANGEGWNAFSSGTFDAGRNFLPAEVRAARPVVVLSTHLASELFGPLSPIGRGVRINGSAFTVVGVFDMSANVFASVIRNFAIVPYTAALKYLDATDEWLSILVVPTAHATQQDAIDQVVAALRTSRGLRTGEPNNFAVVRQDEMLNTFNQITGVFFLVMIALSSVALMVGGVGVVAIMMIAVTERTREIGIRKALGATRREILWQFLVEAVTLTLIGSMIGMLLGASGALLIASTTPIPAAVPLGAVVAALIMAAVAGVFFGLWPAWRASRLDPVVALRYE